MFKALVKQLKIVSTVHLYNYTVKSFELCSALKCLKSHLTVILNS